MSEKHLDRRVERYLSGQGCYWVKTHGSAFGRAGTPDLLVCCRGRFVGIEDKAPSGRVSKLQRRELDLIERAGGVSLVAYDVDAVRAVIEGLL